MVLDVLQVKASIVSEAYSANNNGGMINDHIFVIVMRLKMAQNLLPSVVMLLPRNEYIKSNNENQLFRALTLIT